MYNPNSIGLTLSDFTVNVMYGNLSIADIHTSESPYVGPASDVTIPLRFTPTQQQINNILQTGNILLNQSGSSKITGKGSVKVQKFIFSRTFNFSF
jgi:LEA14-like dessication related protein